MRRALGLLVVLVVVSGCASTDISSSHPATDPSPSSSAMTAAPDLRLLQHQTGQNEVVGKDESFGGYLHLHVTAEGMCGALTSELSSHNPLRGFLWPRGYRVVIRPRGPQILDRDGKWVARDGDFLFTRGTYVFPVDASSIDQRCGHRAGGEYIIKRVSAPGTPFGAKRKPPVLLDCQGLPLIKPTSLMLACDGQWTMSRIHYDTWNRRGASGTAIVHEVCRTSPTPYADEARARFMYGHVRHYHGLLLLGGPPRLSYRDPPCR